MVDPCFQLIIYSLACFAYLIVLCRLQVERILRQAAEFTSEHDTWKLGVAHAFFMQVRSETYKRGGARVCHTRVHCVDETSDIMLMCIYLYMYCIPRAPVAARLNMLTRNCISALRPLSRLCVWLQGDKFGEAISFYEPIVRSKWESILDVTGAEAVIT